jgi:hypothetical protein
MQSFMNLRAEAKRIARATHLRGNEAEVTPQFHRLLMGDKHSYFLPVKTAFQRAD